jgi:hypothetical protein
MTMAAAPSLLDTQRAMLRAIANGETQQFAALVIGDGIAAEARLAIHRNTAINTLVKTLRLSHPAVHRLVGGEFFEAAAQVFLEQHWPGAALLDAFGADFAGFLVDFEPAASLPYLGDVARLEWAVHRALHARQSLPLDPVRLVDIAQQDCGQLRFLADPSLGFVGVDWPVDAIWRAVIDEDERALAQIDPQPQRLWLLVQRADSVGARVQRVSEAHWRFARHLCAGMCLQEAIDSARGQGVEPAADRMLAQLLADGRFADFAIQPGGRQRAAA